MLKEVYVIAEGINYFHYFTSSAAGGEEQPLLTSGFLSAIQSFSLETRDSSIESFTSQNELFLFTQLPNSNKLLICVFEKDTNLNYGDELLNALKRVVMNSQILQVKNVNRIDGEDTQKLWDEVQSIVQSTFTSDLAVENANQQFYANPSIAITIVYDLASRATIFEDARPKRLLKPQIVSELTLLHSSLEKLSQKLQLQDFELLTILSADFNLAIAKNSNYLALAIGTKLSEPEVINNVALTSVGLPKYQSFSLAYSKLDASSKWQVDGSGDLHTIEGMDPPPLLNVFLSTFFNAENRLIEATVRKQYHTTKLYSSIGKIAEIEIKHQTPVEIYYTY